ncbi:ImmA/IrrE family metallo-endopeptidase [Bradyrhizobium sp. SZCCHNS3053]|uniref:ImmA/IrrE family metallo-endopeptidase n=1 Tax=Bradyrhizobium sp. SZCCHNS3053 TaxID=3057322 RepID=UPI0029161E67|nr:ImmA/IrrE family metallo-endopeptidase [Bradyrhizobium sp. SZCCHNS3053]
MSDEDYKDVPRKNSEVRGLAAQLRSFYGVAGAEHIDVLDCASRSEIWTVKGVKPLRLEVVSDDKMAGNAGLTSYDGRTIVIQISRRIRHDAFLGDGYARNTIAHELGHAVMHFEKLSAGAVMARKTNRNVTPKWISAYESAEHHARVFAPAFLINDAIARTLNSVDEISVRFGVSRQSAEIYFEDVRSERDRAASAAYVRRIADETIRSMSPKPSTPTPSFMNDCCSVCSQQTVFSVGHKFMCKTCNTIYDRFQDGDLAE